MPDAYARNLTPEAAVDRLQRAADHFIRQDQASVAKHRAACGCPAAFDVARSDVALQADPIVEAGDGGRHRNHAFLL